MVIFPGRAFVGSRSGNVGEDMDEGESKRDMESWWSELSLLAHMKCSAFRFSPRVDTKISIQPFGSATTVVQHEREWSRSDRDRASSTHLFFDSSINNGIFVTVLIALTCAERNGASARARFLFSIRAFS
jgi:hypothetical protein